MSNGHFAGSGPRPATAPTAPPDGTAPVTDGKGGEGGAAMPWPDEAAAYAARQTAAIHRTGTPAGPEPAAWLDELSMGDQDPAAAVDEIVARVEADPGTASLLRAQALLAELGRDERIASLFEARITRDTVHRIARAED